MSTGTLVSRLKELSEIDAALLRIVSERKKLQGQFDGLSKEIEQLKKDLVQLQGQNTLAKSKYDAETAKVQAEKEKLAARRRALESLGNYKLQQAAAKEIDMAERELSAHEDSLVSLLDGSDLSDKLATEKELLLMDKEEAKSEMLKDLKPTLDTLAEREEKHQRNRDALAVTFDSKDIAIYDGARKRLAPDVMSPIVSGACDFCNLQTPHQMVIQVTAGNSLQKCRGCSRILYVPAES